MADTKQKFTVTRTKAYEPFPEMWHGSQSLLQSAESEPEGAHWKCMAALVMLAFAIEGYCNSAGLAVFGDAWNTGEYPLERKPPKEKLKNICRRLGVDINFGINPWNAISIVMRARDTLAHPKPSEIVVGPIALECYEEDLNDTIAELAVSDIERILQVKTLHAMSNDVLSGLESIHIARGESPISLRVFGMNSTAIQGGVY